MTLTPSPRPARLLLVDGHYYAYRSFYAIQHLTGPSGMPTNMLYGMTKALKRMVSELRPTHAACILDGGMPQERMETQADYKANRAETPAALVQQLPWLERLMPALGFRYLLVDGEEADDVIASYAQAMKGQEVEVIIATNDKDIMQLVDDRVRIYTPRTDGFELLDAAGVEEKWGVPPTKVGEVLRLMGDAVDNIPGVPGIGPKTAAALVREFGSVTELMNRLDEVKSVKQRAALEAARELVARNEVMVRLRSHLPLPAPLASLVFSPNTAMQVELFGELGFRSFHAEARAALGESAPFSPAAPIVPVAASLPRREKQGEFGWDESSS